MSGERLQAVGVDVLDSAGIPIVISIHFSGDSHHSMGELNIEHGDNIHASRTARHLSTLLQTVQLSAPVRLVLALHEVVVVGLAAVSDKVRRAVQRRRRSTDLLHLGDVIGHGGRVDQHLLVKPEAVIFR